MRFGQHAVALGFASDRFDHSSDLPADANAGNRFYGRDVAEFIADGLRERVLDSSFLDEDWGWQVHARRADGSVLEVSIYHNEEEDPARDGDWSLMLRVLAKQRMLGVLPRFREVEVDDDDVSMLENVFGQAGITLRRSEP